MAQTTNLALPLMNADGERRPESKYNDAMQILDAAAGVDQPRVHAYNSSSQSATTAVELLLALPAERYDTDTIHDNATNNSRLTCVTPGDYRISGAASFNTNATGVRYLALKVNGSAVHYTIANAVAGGVFGTSINISYTLTLAVGDYVQLYAYQNSGGALDVISCYLAMEKIG